MHAKGLVLGEQLRDVAVRIFEVAEAQRLRDATVDAGGRGFGIDPRGQAFCQAGIDAVDAESALGRNRQPLGIEGLRLLGGRLAVGKARAVRLVARLIGTRDRAVAAAYAQLVVDGDDTVGPLLGGGGWAHVHARRLVAMHAADRHENTLYRRVLAHFHVEHAPPLHVRRRRVGLLARSGAGPRPWPSGSLSTPAAFQAHAHHVRARTGRVGQFHRHRHQGVHAGYAEILGERRRPVAELPYQQQRVGAYALAHHRPGADVVQWCGDLDQVAFGDA